VDLKAIQQPLKERYRADESASRITLSARASETDAPVSCSVQVGQAIHAAEAHAGVGGPGTAACSGDLLLGALAACAQVTCQMVATAMGIETERIEVIVEGDLDLQGTLGTRRDVPVGFEEIRARFEVDAPGASREQLEALIEKSERYCVVLQTLAGEQRPRVVTTRS
jgi:uncharacterized OsmC-like protein